MTSRLILLEGVNIPLLGSSPKEIRGSRKSPCTNYFGLRFQVFIKCSAADLDFPTILAIEEIDSMAGDVHRSIAAHGVSTLIQREV